MTHDRETLAAIAARIIVESQLTDWTLARRKAVDELGLSSRSTPLPTDEEIIEEIKTYHALYGGEEHAAQLFAQRETALELMRALSRFEPKLVGPVAEGWAHESSAIVLDVSIENAKDLEIELVNIGADIDAREGRDHSVYLDIDNAEWPIRIVARPRGRAPDTRHRVRLSAREVMALLNETA